MECLVTTWTLSSAACLPVIGLWLIFCPLVSPRWPIHTSSYVVSVGLMLPIDILTRGFLFSRPQLAGSHSLSFWRVAEYRVLIGCGGASAYPTHSFRCFSSFFFLFCCNWRCRHSFATSYTNRRESFHRRLLHHIARSAVHGWSSGTFHTPPLLFPFSLIYFSSLLVRSIVHTTLIIVSVPLPLVFSISFSVSGSSVSLCVCLSLCSISFLVFSFTLDFFPFFSFFLLPCFVASPRRSFNLHRHTSLRKGRAGGSPGPVRCKLREAQQCTYWIHSVFFSFFLLVVADLFRKY